MSKATGNKDEAQMALQNMSLKAQTISGVQNLSTLHSL